MSELYHIVGSALQLSPTGGILLASGPTQNQQFIYRRLLTSQDDLLSNLTYGAGIPAMIGSPGNADIIIGIIRQQLKLEVAVQQNPSPIVGIFSDPDTGLFIATIQYVDTTTLETTQIQLPLGIVGNL